MGIDTRTHIGVDTLGQVTVLNSSYPREKTKRDLNFRIWNSCNLPWKEAQPHSEDDPDEEDVLFHGGDPTFLDDKLWGTSTHNDEDWDGIEDDTAHLFD